MTKATVAADAAEGAGPYAPSWPDRLIWWLEGLPIPTWLAFGALGAACEGWVAANAILSERDLQTDGLRLAAIGLLPMLALILMRHLNHTAGEAFDRFRHLLELDDRATQQLRRRVTVLPERPVAFIVGLATVSTVVGAATAPTAFEIEGTSVAASFMLILFASVVFSAYLVLTLQVVRQLVMVGRLHRQARRIDLFETGPLHAFSRLTSQASLGLLALVVLLVATTPQFVTASSSQLITAAAIGLWSSLGVAALASFALPLYGLHRRIAAEKERLQGDADARLKSLLGALHEDASKLDLSRADGLNKLLASAFQEREVLAKLPTWPWQAATLRAFVSALLLPVLVYVLARAAERVVL